MKDTPSSLHRFAWWVFAVGIFYAVVRFFYVEEHPHSVLNELVWLILITHNASLIFHLWIDKVYGRQQIVAALEAVAAPPLKERFSQGQEVVAAGRRINPKYLRFRPGRVRETAVWRRKLTLLVVILSVFWLDCIIYLLGGGKSSFPVSLLPLCYLSFLVAWSVLRYHKDWVYDEIPWLRRVYLGSMAVLGCYGIWELIGSFHLDEPPTIQVYILSYTALCLVIFMSSICRLRWGKMAYPFDEV